MHRILCAILEIELLLICSGESPEPPPAPSPSPIHWPVVPPGPIPIPVPPPPAPGVISKLSADQLFVIGVDDPAVVLASPPGLVEVKTVAGPITIMAKFVDGPNVIETRTFANKSVVTMQAIGSGRAEIIAVYGGLGSNAKVDRRMLDVGGNPPIPPAPPVPPEPDDALLAPMLQAYAADGKPAVQTKALAVVFRNATATANDASLTTLGALFNAVSAAGKQAVPPPALTNVRAVIAKELGTQLGTGANKVLDAATRKACGEQFARMAKLLEDVSR